MVAIAGGGYEIYEYTGEQVTRVAVHNAARKVSGPLHPKLRTIIEAAYDGEGLSRLEIADLGAPPQVRYERLPRDFSVEDACRTVQAELVTQIPHAVGALALVEPAYCVALVYDNPYDPASVTVHIGLEEDRLAFLSEDVENDVLWSPADMARSNEVNLAAVAGTARLLAQELTLAGSAASRDILCAVARTLSERDWSTVLPTTDDFVVYAIDVEMVDLDHNLPNQEKYV